MLREKIAPDYNVPVFHLRKTRVNVLLVRVGFRLSENAIQKRCVSFVLPVVLEGVNVRLRGGGHG